MTLRQPARSLLEFLGSQRGRHVDAKIVHVTGYSAYGYLCGKDTGRPGRPRPPMNLTTIGHRSGRLHTVALAYFPIDHGWAVVGWAGGSEREPHWVRNARANPAAWVRLHRRTTPVVATVRNMAPIMTILMPVALLSTLPVLVLSYANRRPTFYLTLSALVLFVITLLLTMLVEVPIVQQMDRWTVSTLPPDWRRVRDRWGAFHILRAVPSILGIVLLLVGAIF
ncbi:MAG TPA: nitroreductase/quinone reductase family protein [Acidimicrobiales bacterium]